LLFVWFSAELDSKSGVVNFGHCSLCSRNSKHFCGLSCSALHHNNCMYVAHHLITVDKVFQQRLSAVDGTVTVGPGSPPVAASAGLGVPHSAVGVDSGKLMDVVAWVKRLGNDNFTQHVSLNKQQLSDRLRPAKGCLLVGSL